jgi:hypothetical protein
LAASQPVMHQVDMGFLPYFDFGGKEYHFGGHVVVACGYDPASELAHGNPIPAQAFPGKLKEAGFEKVFYPALNTTVEI